LEFPGGRQAFLLFLEKEFAVENLFFFEECNAFLTKCEFSGAIPTELIQDAKDLVSKFIEPSADLCVNISSDCRDKIISKIRKGSVDFEKFVFEEAKEEIYFLMKRDPFRRFKFTEQFKKVCMSSTYDE
jgi:hypothetical protein